MKAAANLPLAVALLVAVLAAATYQMLDKLTVKKYGAATTKVLRPGTRGTVTGRGVSGGAGTSLDSLGEGESEGGGG